MWAGRGGQRADPPPPVLQLSCLANLAALHGLQGDFALHPPDLLLFYNLTQVKGAECEAFVRRATQGDVELLASLPDQRAALRRTALACLGGPRPRLNSSDLQLLGALVCDMDASSIAAADPHVLQNLRCCRQLTAAQQAALDALLASGRTSLGPPGSWDLEGLQSLGPLAAHVRPGLWRQVPEVLRVVSAWGGRGQAPPHGGLLPRQPAGLRFFASTVAACRAGRLSQRDARRLVTGFLAARAVSSRPKRGTGGRCVRGAVSAATLQDDLFLARYDCAQLRFCLGSRVLRANLDPLLQHPLPAECQRVVKAKLALAYPRGLPEEQLRRITSLVYLYSLAEIRQWTITSRDTVVALLAADVALDNQTEAVMQKFLDHNGTLTGALLVAIGGSRLCWMSPRQIQTIRPSEFRLAGALDISACPQGRKNVLFAKAREAFGSARATAAYYRLMRPYLGGAPAEELWHLAQANVTMDIDTFTGLNPHVLQNLSLNNVTTLLGQNVGDLQRARSHPAISSWLSSLNTSALGELGIDKELAGPAGPGPSPAGAPPSAGPPVYVEEAASSGVLAPPRPRPSASLGSTGSLASSISGDSLGYTRPSPRPGLPLGQLCLGVLWEALGRCPRADRCSLCPRQHGRPPGVPTAGRGPPLWPPVAAAVWTPRSPARTSPEAAAPGPPKSAPPTPGPQGPRCWEVERRPERRP
ncbi:Mesothelin-like protein [Galemys pyrenaicus]|uniref:Mesothelin-like protein n=1 Tax=Galemys pyrenaicus TaxID=202257 RepID=A0A8J5ZIR9_GALPY|nr:Mesothelin-like protein [Galemys pyrenaicus]